MELCYSNKYEANVPLNLRIQIGAWGEGRGRAHCPSAHLCFPSFPVCLSIYLSIYNLSIYLSLSLNQPLSQSLFQSLNFFLSLSTSISFSLILNLFLSFNLSLSIYFYISLLSLVPSPIWNSVFKSGDDQVMLLSLLIPSQIISPSHWTSALCT